MSILCSGSFVADILVPELPYIGKPGSLVYAPKGIHLSPGGHSSNVAINLAQLKAKKVHAAGAIGNDEMGKFLINQIKNRGIKPHPEIIRDTTTAKNVALLVKNEDRRYIAELTANSQLTTEHVVETVKDVRPEIFYQGTLGGLPNIENNLSSILKETKKLQAFNILDVIIPSNSWAYLENSAKYIDIFHANQLEASDLTEEENPSRASIKLNKMGVMLSIISDSKNGLTASTRNHLVTMPAFDVQQIDPTGAGDALCAGVIKHIQEASINPNEIKDPNHMIDLLIMGQATGAACVTGLGATTNVTEKKVKKLLSIQENQIREHTQLKKL